MRIGEIAISVKYWMGEKFQNANFWIFDSFPNWKNSENLLHSKSVKFWKFIY